MEKSLEYSSPDDKPGEEQLAYLGLEARNLHGMILELGSGRSEKLKDTPSLPNDCKIISLGRGILDGHRPFIRNLRNKEGWDRNTIQADAESLPLDRGVFDFVISVDAIPLFLTSDPAIRTGFKEIWRVLKPGGEARLFPVNVRDFTRAQDLFRGLGGEVTLQRVDPQILQRYGYFDKSSERLIIKKPL